MARDMLDNHGVINMTTQPGCPFPLPTAQPRYAMRFTPATAEDEALKMSLMVRQIQDKDLNHHLPNDTFTINHKWVREFCRVYPDNRCLIFTSRTGRNLNQGMLKDL